MGTQTTSPRPRGRLWVLTAPSGAGKTTLVRRLTQRKPKLRFSVSSTTRPPRAGEVDGRDYFFVSPDAFEKRLAQGAFLEHAEVFGNRYGTDREQVERELGAGHDVILEIDWQGAHQVRERMPECALVFIMPPSLTELERRLRGRATETEAVIGRRLREARDDIRRWPDFDYVVINDELDAAVQRLVDVLDGRGEASAVDRPDLRARLQRIQDGD